MASIQHKKGKDGKKTYYVVVSFSGKHKWIRAGSLANARVLKREIESLEESKRVEKLGLVKKDKRIDHFFDEYLERCRVRTAPNTVKRYRAALNAFLAYLSLNHSRLKYLSQIKQEHIEGFQQKRLESVELKKLSDGDKIGVHKRAKLPKPQTVNYEVSVLRSAFLWAMDRELISRVPTAKVKPLKVTGKKPAQILSKDECALLLDTARSMAEADSRMTVYFKAFTFLLNSGLRPGELCWLTWDDVELDLGMVKIQEKESWSPKSYARDVFLNKTCQRLLKAFRSREGYVFKRHTGRQLRTDDLRRVLIKVSKRAGLEGFTRVHDLRHTFASHMQMNGVDQGTVAAILGHQDLSTTLIYTHQTTEHLKKSVEKVGLSD